MEERIRKVFYKIADDLTALATAILEDDSISINTKVNRNTLADSALRDDIFSTVSQTAGDDPVVTAFFNNYVTFLEWDRPPEHGKRPPLDSLVEWAKKNNIETDASTLWVISNAIWRDGHKGRPIFATITVNLDRLFDEDWSEWLFEELTHDLDNFFQWDT